MIKQIIIHLLKIYQQYIRVFFAPTCRFSPSCSEYATLAVDKYGVTMGLIKTAKRLLRCHPFCDQSGYDPLL